MVEATYLCDLHVCGIEVRRMLKRRFSKKGKQKTLQVTGDAWTRLGPFLAYQYLREEGENNESPYYNIRVTLPDGSEKTQMFQVESGSKVKQNPLYAQNCWTSITNACAHMLRHVVAYYWNEIQPDWEEFWRPVAEPDEDKLELEPGEGKTVHRLFRIPLTFEATQKNIPNCWLNEKPTKAIKSYLSNKTHAAYLTLGQDVSLRYIYTNKIVYNYPPMEVLLPPPSDNQTEFSNDDAQKIERMDLEYLVARVFCARLAVVVGCLPGTCTSIGSLYTLTRAVGLFLELIPL